MQSALFAVQEHTHLFQAHVLIFTVCLYKSLIIAPWYHSICALGSMNAEKVHAQFERLKIA
jgi:hypothetical protein